MILETLGTVVAFGATVIISEACGELYHDNHKNNKNNVIICAGRAINDVDEDIQKKIAATKKRIKDNKKSKVTINNEDALEASNTIVETIEKFDKKKKVTKNGLLAVANGLVDQVNILIDSHYLQDDEQALKSLNDQLLNIVDLLEEDIIELDDAEDSIKTIAKYITSFAKKCIEAEAEAAAEAEEEDEDEDEAEETENETEEAPAEEPKKEKKPSGNAVVVVNEVEAPAQENQFTNFIKNAVEEVIANPDFTQPVAPIIETENGVEVGEIPAEEPKKEKKSAAPKKVSDVKAAAAKKANKK